MARIRTIKPEFPHSESMGRVSRDARLTFIELWTLADDGGRLRGNSRMLASLLFPYDDDAKDLIEGWLVELEREKCIQRYVVDGTSYLQICNWLEHQKIDKPTASKLPPPDSPSRILANPRESSSLDLDQGRDQGEEGKGEDARARGGPEVSRGTPGVIDCGTALTATGVWESMLEDWKRDVPECNPEAFTRWIVHVESLGKPMHAAMRLGQAKRLAGNGDFAAQAEVVQFCIEQGYKSLIPISDVRARTNGMSRAPPLRTQLGTKRTWRVDEEEAGAGG